MPSYGQHCTLDPTCWLRVGGFRLLLPFGLVKLCQVQHEPLAQNPGAATLAILYMVLGLGNVTTGVLLIVTLMGFLD